MNSWLKMLNSYLNLIPCCQPEAAIELQNYFDSQEILKCSDHIQLGTLQREECST